MDDVRSHTERYLRAQGLLDGEPFVLVDMEGHGNVGALLTALLAHLDAPPPAVECYVALTRPTPSPGRTILGYLYDDATGTGVRERTGEVYVAMEMFSAGSHGTVLGYRTVDGEVLPVLAFPGNDRVLTWGLGAYRDLLDACGDALGTALAAQEQQVAAIADGFTTWQVIASLHQRQVSMRAFGTWPAGVRARAPWHLRLRAVQHQVEARRRRRVALAGTTP